MAAVGPVDLGLFTGQGAKPQIGLGHRTRSMPRHEVAEVVGATEIAALAHHDVKPAGRQRRELRQRLEDERQVSIGLAGPGRQLGAQDARLREHLPHGVAVHMKLACNGAHTPEFGLVKAQDLRAQLRGYGHDWGYAEGIQGARVACSRRDTSGNARLPDPSGWWPTRERLQRRYTVWSCMAGELPRWQARLVEWQPVQHPPGQFGNPDASPIAPARPCAGANTGCARRA